MSHYIPDWTSYIIAYPWTNAEPKSLAWFSDIDYPTLSVSNPDSKVHVANMGPTWGRQDPGGPHVGHVNLAIWEGLDFYHTFQIIHHAFENRALPPSLTRRLCTRSSCLEEMGSYLGSISSKRIVNKWINSNWLLFENVRLIKPLATRSLRALNLSSAI